jgi:hypothetical protein
VRGCFEPTAAHDTSRQIGAVVEANDGGGSDDPNRRT